MFNVFFFHVYQFDPFPPFVPSSYPLNLYFAVLKKNTRFLITLGHLITVLYQLAIAIYLQSLLPPANAICGSHEHIQSCLCF